MNEYEYLLIKEIHSEIQKVKERLPEIERIEKIVQKLLGQPLKECDWKPPSFEV